MTASGREGNTDRTSLLPNLRDTLPLEAVPLIVVSGENSTGGRPRLHNSQDVPLPGLIHGLFFNFSTVDRRRRLPYESPHGMLGPSRGLLEHSRLLWVLDGGDDVLRYLGDELLSPKRIGQLVVNHPDVPDIEGHVVLVR